MWDKKNFTTEEIYEVEFIIPLILGIGRHPKYVIFDDRLTCVNSVKLNCFKKKGTTCFHCKIKGTEFHLEKDNLQGNYLLNLYAKNRLGELVLMTIDHIQPKSKGGSVTGQHNLQPMCYYCNQKKGDKWNSFFDLVGSLDDNHKKGNK